MVDRADPLSRPGPIRGTDPGPNTASLTTRLGIVLPVIACLELAWLGWFLVAPLPNVQNVVIRRGMLLLKTFPEVVPDTTFRDSLLGRGLAELSHVENLPQRLPIVLVAALIAGAAIGLGDTIIGLIRIRERLRYAQRIALAYGLGAAILGGITLCLGRMGWLDPWLIRIGLAGLASLSLLRIGSPRRPAEDATAPPPRTSQDLAPSPGDGAIARRRDDPLAWLFCLLIAPFVIVTLLGSMLPATDFDVLEYHLEGPKEYFQAGRIQFLTHNVYTNMPFDVEMLHLLGMEVMADWWWGGLSGQLLVALFGPAAAVLIYATAARVSLRAGWLAALIYLSTPWIYRLGVIAYVEGPLCFYHAALVWGWSSRPSASNKEVTRGWLLLGLLAGAAMGCKYTALVSAVVPFGLLTTADGWRLRSIRPLLAFGLGWGLVMGPWLVKNVIDTGDPVYPLGYRFFHGRGWDEAMQTKWQTAHGPRPYTWKELASSIVDVAGRSDWQSPLYAALAPLALLRRGSRPLSMALWTYAIYLFLTWWLFTHRLDRFWLPILPILAVLAGLGAVWVRHRGWTAMLSGILAVALVANLAYDSSALAGLNEWTGDLDFLRRDLPERLNRPLASLDARLSPDARVLLVGQAAVFHVRRSILYNTVFNAETIEELATGKDSAALYRALRARQITHIYVDWKEIQRHRQPGGYGFTGFVTPQRFAGWVAEGLLDRPVPCGPEQDLYRVR
jgi:hypothetical protein